jgi:pimeloyl-ACP methyl ester carboxylesterase
MKIIRTKSFELATNSRGDRSSSKLALVLPGRLDTKDYPHMVSHVNNLASQGYLALSFDPPGTWESPGDISLYTTTNYLKTIHELIELYGNKPTVLMGHSRGGSIAMLAGAQNEYVTKVIAAMTNMGPSKIEKDRVVDETLISYRDIPPADTKHKKVFRMPLNYFADARQHNILEALKHNAKPKLFILGTKDQDIKQDVMRVAFDAAAEPKLLREVAAVHDYRYDEKSINQINEIVGTFLKTH